MPPAVQIAGWWVEVEHNPASPEDSGVMEERWREMIGRTPVQLLEKVKDP